MRRNIHPLIAGLIASAEALRNSAQPSQLPLINRYQMGAFGYSGIVGTGKSRKKKSNKIHHSRMLRRKHAKK